MSNENEINIWNDLNILENIGKYLPIKYLLSSRLVSKSFYNAFSKRLVIQFCNHPTIIFDPKSFLDFHKNNFGKENGINLAYTKFDFSYFRGDPFASIDLLHRLTIIKFIKLPIGFEMSVLHLKKFLLTVSLSVEHLEFDMNIKKSIKNDGLWNFEAAREGSESSFNLKKIKSLTVKIISEVSAELWTHLLTSCYLAQKLNIDFGNNNNQNQKLLYITLSLLEKPNNVLRPTHFGFKIPDLNEGYVKFLIKVVKKNKMENIVYNGTYLSYKTISDFFIVHSPIRGYRNMAKNYEFLDLKVKAVKKMESYDDMLLIRILFHFPNLEELTLCEKLPGDRGDSPVFIEGNLETIVLEKLDFKNGEFFEKKAHPPYKTLKIFNYSAIGDVEFEPLQRISRLFPNLTELTVDVFSVSYANLNNVFLNLTKLTKLEIITKPKFITKDARFTGLTDEYILKSLKGLPYNHLKTIKYEDLPKKAFEESFNTPIFKLKDLKYFAIKSYNFTEMSLFFGFRHLRNLEILKIPQASTFNESALQLFLDEFSKLEYLEISDVYKPSKIIQELQKNRPFLKLKFTPIDLLTAIPIPGQY